MESLPARPAITRAVDERVLRERHEAVVNFSKLQPVLYFTTQARRKRIKQPPTALDVLVEVKPAKDASLTLPGHIRCDVITTLTQAWSLGTIGIDDHQLHITSGGNVLSLTPELTYDGKTVVHGYRWPLKVLVPFDLGSLDDDQIEIIVDRIMRLASQTH